MAINVLIANMHLKFRSSFDNIDSFSEPEYSAEQIDLLLNESQDELINQCINSGAEETQSNTDFLANLIKTDSISTFLPGSKDYGVLARLPSDYRTMLLERAKIYYPHCPIIKSGKIDPTKTYIITQGSIIYNTVTYTEDQIFNGVQGRTKYSGTGEVHEALLKKVPVKPETRDRYNKIIQNPFKQPYEDLIIRLESSKSTTSGPQIYELISNKNIIIQEYYIDYYKNPEQMQYGAAYAPSNPQFNININCELTDEACNRIVQMAVSKAKAIIGSQDYQVVNIEEQKTKILN